MTKANFFMVAGDTAPELHQTLLERREDGTVAEADLSEASGVELHVYDSDGDLVLDESGVVEEPLEGLVAYYWASGDTELAGGYYKMLWHVTFDDATTRSYPNPGNNYLRIKTPGSA